MTVIFTSFIIIIHFIASSQRLRPIDNFSDSPMPTLSYFDALSSALVPWHGIIMTFMLLYNFDRLVHSKNCNPLVFKIIFPQKLYCRCWHKNSFSKVKPNASSNSQFLLNVVSFIVFYSIIPFRWLIWLFTAYSKESFSHTETERERERERDLSKSVIYIKNKKRVHKKIPYLNYTVFGNTEIQCLPESTGIQY